MIKKNLPTIILTSVITLTPLVAGLILWDKLPDTLATHFGTNNEPNGFMSKPMTVFLMPIVLLALHWFCILGTKLDPKNKNISQKLFNLVLWIIPVLSIFMAVVVYGYALNKAIKVGFIVLSFLGVLFVIIGNYLPKSKPSYTVGIKLPWTINDSENWERTHRLAGKLWVLFGAVIAITAFLENPIIVFSCIGIMTVIPFIYSVVLYKKKKARDTQ